MRNVAWVLATVFLLTIVTTAAVTESEAKRITEAANVLQELRSTPDKDIPEAVWDNASCIAVIPSVKKAAFIVGGEYGKGLISCRHDGHWSAPSFILLEKGSLGFQIGGETIDLVLVIKNDHGLNKLLEDKVALGAEASIAGGPMGRDARAMTDAQLKAEILSYSRAQGIFAGVDLTGGVLQPDKEDNQDLYGKKNSAREILLTNAVKTPKVAEPFIAALKRTTPSQAHR